MGARHYDLVAPNYSALKADLAKYGLTAEQVAKSMGKDRAFIPGTFRKEKVDRSVIEAVEDRMFREHGSYYTEITDEPEQPAAPPEPKMTEGMGILLKKIIAKDEEIAEKTEDIRMFTDAVRMTVAAWYGERDKKMDDVIKAVKESNAANEVILQDILQKQKELTTLAAKILSRMERGQKE